ncbi:hypothetical protein FJY68_13930 [candidate division WOR-3 bacterium]|uniref:Uncharacterized protein n=1 Tax=candidate division WOR-3 bacterium TaxID=2052148 RepID=A0A938BR95_UNCW3|nr:hypothetical protein [candidate division WOR-3 bacterium]
MRICVLPCLLAVAAISCHKVPYDDMMSAPQTAEIDGQTFTLDGGAYRNFMPGANSSLMVGVTLTGSDTARAFPSSVLADRVWVIKSQHEVWGAILREPVHRWPKYSVRYHADGGPKWSTRIWVSVAVRVRSADGRTWLLRDPEVWIEMAI